MHTRAERRFNQYVKQQRRLKEDQAQHGGRAAMNDPRGSYCPCFDDKRAQARFKDTPTPCSDPWCCGNPRRYGKSERLTLQERRVFQREE